MNSTNTHFQMGQTQAQQQDQANTLLMDLAGMSNAQDIRQQQNEIDSSADQRMGLVLNHLETMIPSFRHIQYANTLAQDAQHLVNNQEAHIDPLYDKEVRDEPLKNFKEQGQLVSNINQYSIAQNPTLHDSTEIDKYQQSKNRHPIQQYSNPVVSSTQTFNYNPLQKEQESQNQFQVTQSQLAVPEFPTQYVGTSEIHNNFDHNHQNHTEIQSQKVGSIYTHEQMQIMQQNIEAASIFESAYNTGCFSNNLQLVQPPNLRDNKHLNNDKINKQLLNSAPEIKEILFPLSSFKQEQQISQDDLQRWAQNHEDQSGQINNEGEQNNESAYIDSKLLTYIMGQDTVRINLLDILEPQHVDSVYEICKNQEHMVTYPQQEGMPPQSKFHTCSQNQKVDPQHCCKEMVCQQTPQNQATHGELHERTNNMGLLSFQSNQDLTNNFYPPQENYNKYNNNILQANNQQYEEGQQMQKQVRPVDEQPENMQPNQAQPRDPDGLYNPYLIMQTQHEIGQNKCVASIEDDNQSALYKQNQNTINNNQNKMHQMQQNQLNGQGVPPNQQQQQLPQNINNQQMNPNQGFLNFHGQQQQVPMQMHQQHQPHLHQNNMMMHHSNIQGSPPQHQLQQQSQQQQQLQQQHLQQHPQMMHHPQNMQQMVMAPNNNGMQQHLPHELDNANILSSQDPKRTYRKKKTWMLYLNITIETPELDNRLNESFEIEIGSNQRLKILHQTIQSHVKNLELRELIRKEKTYIYIEGKEPVARKSKSLAEMGVKDGDHLIVTTEMKLPFDYISEEEDPLPNQDEQDILVSQNVGNEEPFDRSLPVQKLLIQNTQIEYQKTGNTQLTPPHMRNDHHLTITGDIERIPSKVGSNLPPNQQENIGIASKSAQLNQKYGQNNLTNQYNQKAGNVSNSVNGSISKMGQKPSGKETGASRKTKKATPAGEKKPRENQPKSPATKKIKDVQYVKILVLQQLFKQDDIKKDTKDADDIDMVEPEIAEDEEKPTAEDKNENNVEAEDNEKDQIDSKVVEADHEFQGEEMEPMEERQSEDHAEYERSEQEAEYEASEQHYDPNEIWELEVNSKNKAKSLKNLILEKIKLNKKANILLFKKNTNSNPENQESQVWEQFNEKDFEMGIKFFSGQTIAFKAYLDVTVGVDGRGQSYKQTLRVDPKDSMDKYLRKNTHFWRTFMMRGQHKCIVSIQNKGDEDTIYVAPDDINKSFIDNGVYKSCQITLIEYRNMRVDGDDSDNEENGEEEMEEMEDDEEREQDEQQSVQEVAVEEVADDIAQIVEDGDNAEKKKASDVLFNDQHVENGQEVSKTAGENDNK